MARRTSEAASCWEKTRTLVRGTATTISAVFVGHLKVHEDHVGAQACRLVHRRLADMRTSTFDQHKPILVLYTIKSKDSCFGSDSTSCAGYRGTGDMSYVGSGVAKLSA